MTANALAHLLPFRLWRLYWLVRLRWQARQLTKMQRRAAAILLANHARLADALPPTATFGARWHRSGRTVETWEQGTRQPDPLVLDGMRALAARTKQKAAINGAVAKLTDLEQRRRALTAARTKKKHAKQTKG